MKLRVCISIGVLGLNTLSLNLHHLLSDAPEVSEASDQVVVVPFVELLAQEIGGYKSPIVQLEI